MRALSVRQPHASLIALGLKPDETRSFEVSYRGPLAICAGATYGPRERAVRDRLLEQHAEVWKVLDGGRLELPLGFIVAVTELVACDLMHPETIAAASPGAP